MDISILGKGPSVRECQYDTNEIWGLNNVSSMIEKHNENPKKRFDKIFSVDPYPDDQWIKEMKDVAPVVSFQPYADIRYPLEEIRELFRSDYFCNVGSYAIAYALFTHVGCIKLYGCDQAWGAVYPFEHRSIEYWLGRAQERGVEVILPENTRILKPLTGGLYGMPRKYTVPLDIQERLILMHMIPTECTYEEAANTSALILFLQPQNDEMKKYNVKQVQYPDGRIGWTPEYYYTIDIGFTPALYQYIKELLIEADRSRKLAPQAASLYEKFVLNDIDA